MSRHCFKTVLSTRFLGLRLLLTMLICRAHRLKQKEVTALVVSTWMTSRMEVRAPLSFGFQQKRPEVMEDTPFNGLDNNQIVET
jgi:hypothetical protein